MENAGDNVDRAKKQASTTFCVEIRQNKQTQVDCDELNNRPLPPPPPPPAPEPEEPVPPPPPPPAAPAPQPEPQNVNYQLQPCEPEIAAFYVQPPGQIVYAPTGNCAQHVPALLHLPSSNPLYTLPSSSGGASGIPSINVLHLPSGSLPNTGYGVGPTVIPLHTTGGPGSHHHGTHHHGGLPHHGYKGLHGTHQLSGVECTCTETLAKSANGSPPSNEALAMKFLQDVQRNAPSSGSPTSPTMV